MKDFPKDPDLEARKLDEKIKKLQEEKALLKEKYEEEKQQIELAKLVGWLIIKKFEGQRFTYSDLEIVLEENLKKDYDRSFFKLQPLPEEAKPAKRGRKPKPKAEANTSIEE